MSDFRKYKCYLYLMHNINDAFCILIKNTDNNQIVFVIEFKCHNKMEFFYLKRTFCHDYTNVFDTSQIEYKISYIIILI